MQNYSQRYLYGNWNICEKRYDHICYQRSWYCFIQFGRYTCKEIKNCATRVLLIFIIINQSVVFVQDINFYLLYFLEYFSLFFMWYNNIAIIIFFAIPGDERRKWSFRNDLKVWIKEVFRTLLHFQDMLCKVLHNFRFFMKHFLLFQWLNQLPFSDYKICCVVTVQWVHIADLNFVWQLTW